MTTAAWYKSLVSLKACPFGLKRAVRAGTFQELWDSLDRGDWMMWALSHGEDVSDATFMDCAKECASMVGVEFPGGARAGKTCSQVAVDVTTPYLHGSHEFKLKIWKQLARVVRKHFPQPPQLPGGRDS